MTGNDTPQQAVKSVDSFAGLILGPLSKLVDPGTERTAANAPIKAIWRNEIGSAQAAQTSL